LSYAPTRGLYETFKTGCNLKRQVSKFQGDFFSGHLHFLLPQSASSAFQSKT